MKIRFFLTLLAASFMWISCADKGGLEPENPNGPKMETRKITISGVLVPDSKTSLNSDGKVLWTPGDKIAVCYNDKASLFTSTNVENSEVANFEGYVTVPADVITEDLQLIGTYPGIWASYDKGKWWLDVGEIQEAVDGTFPEDILPMVAASKNLTMNFYNLCGLLEFTLERNDIIEVQLKGNNGEILAGWITWKFDANGIPSISDCDSDRSTITLSKKDKSAFNAGTKYYIVLQPTTFSGGFTMSFIKSDGTVLVKEINKSVEIKRSVISYLAEADKDAVVQSNDTYISLDSDANFKAYCLANFDLNKDQKISTSEAALVTKIDIQISNYQDKSQAILSSLADVSGFPNLEELRVNAGDYIWIDPNNRGGLTSVNLNENTKLKSVFIHGYSNLESVTLGQCKDLESLGLGSPLHMTGDYESAYVAKGKLYELDVSNNTKLRSLNVTGQASLTSLDLSHCESLEKATVYYNGFTSFTLGQLPNLNRLYLSGNTELASVDLSGCPNLTWLAVYNMPSLAEVNLTANGKLEYLWGSSFEKIVFPDEPMQYLTELGTDAYQEEVDVDVTNLPNLESLSIWHFKSLDLTGASKVKRLWMSSSYCSSVDLSPCAALEDLEMDSWAMFTTLDISNNRKLAKFTNHGAEALEKLYVGVGQEIEGVTVNRSDSQIHPNTEIVQKGGISTEGFEREAI